MLAAQAPQRGDGGQPSGADGIGAVFNRGEMRKAHQGDPAIAEDLALQLVAQGRAAKPV